MALYHFHVDDGTFVTDLTGTDLPDEEAARNEAVRAGGAMLTDLDGEFWGGRRRWSMHVTDAAGRLLFSLHFLADMPSGEIRFVPMGPHRQLASSADEDSPD